MIGRFKVISFLFTFTLTLFLALSTTTIAAATTLTVNNSTGPIANYTSIQEAINSANEGDIILVYPGTYSENVNVNVANISIRSFSGNPKNTVVVAQNSSDHVFNVSSDLIEIRGFTIKGAKHSSYGHYSSGVFLNNISEANIGYNILQDNQYGTFLNNSRRNFLIGNNITGSSFGIYIVNLSNSNTLTNNYIANNRLISIYHGGSSNNFLINNIVDNGLYGVFLTDSINTTFTSNLIWNHSYNFYIAGDQFDTNKIYPSNLVNGKPVYYLVGASDAKLDLASKAGVVYLINCKNIIVKDQLLENNMHGVYIYNTTNSSLINNTVSNNYYGIYVSSSSNNILMKNNASNNRHGISLESSKINTLNDNIVDSNYYGIFLDNSSSNGLNGNNIKGNKLKGIFIKNSIKNILSENKVIFNRNYGIDLYNSSANHLANNIMENNIYNFNVSISPSYSEYLKTNEIEPNNLVDGKSIYYFSDVSDTELNSLSNAGTVYLINCHNILLKDLFLERNGNGIYLYNTTEIILENSTIINNRQGVFLWNVTRSTMFFNRVSSNQYSGIFLAGSSNNTIFNNYFCNKNNVKLEGINTGNVWNITKTARTNIANGGFLGGNFWGTPFESGFSQKNIKDIDRDSICDTFYSIDEKNIDFLPLLYVPVHVLTYNSVGDAATGSHTWNYTNCDFFPNGKANDVLTESLVVNAGNKTVNFGELVYETEIKSVNYRYQGEDWRGKNYSIIGFFGNTFVPLRSETDQVWKLYPKKFARLTFDSKDMYNLRIGEPLYLGDGHAIEVKQLDNTGEKAWFEFTREGEFVDDEIISIGRGDSTWYVKLDDIQGENDIVVLMVHINKTFKENLDNIINIEGIWLIDYKNAFTVEPGDEFGVLTVSSIEDNYLEMKNSKPIILERNSICEIAGGLNFKVLDSSELIYYPFKEVTINLEENPLINNFYPLASEISTTEGEVQEFFINTNRNSNITFFINGNEVKSNNSTTYFSYQNNNVSEGIYYVRAVARADDEEALHSWIWVVGNEIVDGNSNENGGQNRGSSSGGGGDVGGSPEPASNVETKELSQAFITNGKHVKFDFTRNVTSIKSVEFDAKRTFGKTTAIVEMLKGKSQLASQLPPGIVYRNINIWVGNEGMSSAENIENAVVDFKVEKSWIMENHVNISSISLYRYKDNTWNALQTVTAGEDDKYVYFRAETPGFSPFAIVGEREAEATNLKTISEIEEVNENSAGDENFTSSKPQEKVKSPGFESWLVVSGLLCVVERLRKKGN